MCGIAGLWHLAGSRDLAAQSRAMTKAIASRGPDGEGHWTDPAAGIALGHRRLAIIDLSPTGFQPMTSADGRIVITYNGELYNRAEMAAELDRPGRGTSDTEVLVETIARYGIDGALARANGLFAFAAFDRTTRTLHLARDRLGIKPLYWTRQNGLFGFASELKALRAAGGLALTLDPGAVASYLRYLCVPAPRTIFREVEKLAPGHRLEVNAANVAVRRYWDVAGVARRGQQAHDRRAEPDIVEELHALLAGAVKRQMVSDVPLGAFLSGGIDSSAVVALMQRAASRPVKTFSIGFREQAFNEAANARAVAHHLGTDHTELVLSAADAQAIIPELPAIYDEIFGGYVRYQGIARLAGAARRLPRPLRRLAARSIELISADAWDMLARPLPQRFKPRHAGDKIRKGAALLGEDDALDMYRRVVSHTPRPGCFLPGVSEPADVIEGSAARLRASTRSRSCGFST